MNIEELMDNARLKGRVIALEAEVQTLTAEVRCLLEAVIRSHERVDSLIVANLKAELERLRKAGDELAEAGSLAGCSECCGLYERLEDALKAWNAAKEGKQSEEVLWVQLEDYEKLKAENERLRKAGDELYDWAGAEDCPQRVYDAWNAAKEGKQS